MDHQECTAMLEKGMSIAREHFAEIELAICKGKRMALENVLDWLTTDEQALAWRNDKRYENLVNRLKAVAKK